MDHITVRFSDLVEAVRQMKEDNIETVTISLFEASVEGGERIPARMEFEGATSDDPDYGIVYDEIESVSTDD